MSVLTDTERPLVAGFEGGARLRRFQQRLVSEWDNSEDGLSLRATGRLAEIFGVLDEIIDAAGCGEPDICPVDDEIVVTWHLRDKCDLDICPVSLDVAVRLSGADRRCEVMAEFNLLDACATAEVQKILASAKG